MYKADKLAKALADFQQKQQDPVQTLMTGSIDDADKLVLQLVERTAL